MTLQVKQELAAVEVTRPMVRAAEATAFLRFAGEQYDTPFGTRLRLALDTEAAARRAVRMLNEAFDAGACVQRSAEQGTGGLGRFHIAVDRPAAVVLRDAELVTRSGVRIVGLPPKLVSGTIVEGEAVWRAALLCHGTLTESGRSSLEIVCPGVEAAMALAGCARRMGLHARTKEARGHERVYLRDGEAIGALLTRLGAHRSRLFWEEQRLQQEVRSTANRLANFDDANLRRSAQAATAAAAKVERAMEILGDDVPDHLLEAGALRIRYRKASLEELGRLSDPQLTKDAIAGRIRRLVSMANKRAQELGIPGTAVAASAAGEQAADSEEH
ncbi:DNA-binding protein WhiA [Corynebacterium choanae]